MHNNFQLSLLSIAIDTERTIQCCNDSEWLQSVLIFPFPLYTNKLSQIKTAQVAHEAEMKKKPPNAPSNESKQ